MSRLLRTLAMPLVGRGHYDKSADQLETLSVLTVLIRHLVAENDLTFAGDCSIGRTKDD